MTPSIIDQLASKYLRSAELLTHDYFKRAPDDNGVDDISRWVIPASHRLVFVNGHFQESLSAYPSQLFQMTDDGCVLTVMANQKIDQPLHVIHLHKNAELPVLKKSVFFIKLQHHAELTVFEEHVSVDQGCYLTDCTTEVQLEKNALLTYYKWQHDSLQSYHFATTRVFQDTDSTWHYVVVSNGAKISADDVMLTHRDKGSVATLHGLFLARGDQQVMHRTRADHFGVNGSTNQHYRGLASGDAKGIFDGQMIVHPGAIKSSVHQLNHNLLLSDTAEIDTKPTLEIYADDVTASHGATVGQLDEDALFYCQARGISFSEARQLLVSGFMNALFDELPSHAISDYVRTSVSEDL